MSTDPVFMKIGGQYYWYHNDHLGTPQMMTTSSGAVVWKAKYSSFGKAEVDPGSTVLNPFRFPGQYEDQETGWHYNYWRNYDSLIGRYVSADPIGYSGGLNLFSYVLNNPINFFDQFGLKVWKCTRPVNKKPGESYLPIYNHQYICMTGKDGKPVCRGITYTKYKPLIGSPARYSKDNEDDYFNDKACEEVEVGREWYPSCTEKCLEKKFKEPLNFTWAIRPGATDCREWTRDTLNSCISECKYYARPSTRYRGCPLEDIKYY
jgi:RHS repeat-associated protein